MSSPDPDLARKLATQDAALEATGFLIVLVLLAAIVAVIVLLRLLYRREAQYSHASQRFHDITDVSPEWFWETDSQHRFTYFSQRLMEVTGLDLRHLYGRSRWDIAESRTADPHWRRHLADLSARRPFSNFVYELEDAHGRQRHVMVSGKPVFDDSGAFLGYRGTGIDVTESVRAQAAARAAERRAAAVIAAAPDAFLAVDADGVVVDWNERAASLLGWSPEEAIGADLDALVAADPGSAPADFCLRGFLTEVCQEPGQTRRMETTLLNRRGETVPVELTVTAILAAEGTQYAAFLRDISNDRAWAQALREAKEAAEVANRTKSQFLAAMSHELRTPLNAVIGFSDIMERGLLGPPPVADQTDSRQIGDSGRHLLNVINDILDISKVEAGRIELDETAVDLYDVTRRSILLVRERAEQGGVEVVNAVSEALPEVWGDRQRLTQILLNLLSNAVKFAPGGTVRVEADSGEEVMLCVRDDGVGMDAAEVPEARTAFVQLDSPLNLKNEGTGLGLALCDHLARLHGGWLHIDSAPGAGTAVTLNLPASRLLAGSDTSTGSG
jgi:PAS domain S-box-containing protein